MVVAAVSGDGLADAPGPATGQPMPSPTAGGAGSSSPAPIHAGRSGYQPVAPTYCNGPPDAVVIGCFHGPVTLRSYGELRYIGSLPPTLTLDAAGTQLGQGPVLDQRLRAGIDLRPSNPAAALPWSVSTSWDVFSGQLAGDPWDLPGSIDERHREQIGVLYAHSFLPREAVGELRLGPIGVQAGLTTSYWGLGMVANDGNHDAEFGRSDFGDRVLRLRLGTRPFQKGAFPLTLAIAGDRVVQDDLVRAGVFGPAGQVAWQGVLAAAYTPQSGNVFGIYGVYRDQTEPLLNGETIARTTRLGVIDGYGEGHVAVGALELRAGGEFAGIRGHTTRTETYNSTDGIAILAHGATGYLGVARSVSGYSFGLAEDLPPSSNPAKLPPAHDVWSAKVRAGWASGDADPNDGVSGDFTFDRDYDVGMLLYREQMGGIEAADYALISDPGNAGQAPDGADLTVTEGSFRRAIFAQPVMDVAPLAWLGVRAGVMRAWSTAPIEQPYYTFRNGGTPTNYLGQPTSRRALGTEIDVAVRVGGVPVGYRSVRIRPDVLVQGAYLFGAPDMGGGIASMLTGTVQARW